MNLKTRAITAIFLSVILIGLAILIWAYQNGKITIFGSQQTTQGTITVDSYEEWKQGVPDEHADIETQKGDLMLKRGGGLSVWENKNSQGAQNLGYDPHNYVLSNYTGDIIDMAYDKNHEKMVLLAFNSTGIGWANAFEFWTYDIKGNSWSKIFTHDPIGPIIGADNIRYFGYYLGSHNPLTANHYYDDGYLWSNYLVPDTEGNIILFTASGSYKVNLDTNNLELITNFNNAGGISAFAYPPPFQAGKALDSQSKKIYFFGGATNYQGIPPFQNKTFEVHNTLWVYDIQNKTFEKVSNSLNVPAGRYGATMTFDPDNNQLIMFGGLDKDRNPLDETYVYKIAENKWSNKDTVAVPGKRANAAMVWDPENKVAVMFGGQTSINSATNTVWNYNPKENTWTKISTENAPSERTSLVMAYDEKNKNIVLYDGREVEDIKDTTATLGYKIVPKKPIYDTWTLSASGYFESGSYTTTYGSNEIISWDKFKCGNTTIPEGTRVKYQFSGSLDNVSYSSYSEEKECEGVSSTACPSPTSDASSIESTGCVILENGEISLSGLIPNGSKYLRVKINLYTDDSSKTPVVDNFFIDYTTAGVTPPTPQPVCGNGVCEQGEDANNCPGDCKHNGSICGNGKCESGETKDNCPKDCDGGGDDIGKLVSTGAVLWFNLLIALLVAGIVTYLLFKKPRVEK